MKDDCMVFEETLDSHMGELRIPWWSVDVRPIEVEKAFGCLKVNQSPGPDDAMSEQLRYGSPNSVYVHERGYHGFPEIFHCT